MRPVVTLYVVLCLTQPSLPFSGHADLYEGAPGAAPATPHEGNGLQVLRLPRKMILRCSKCCACQAKAGGAQVTQDVASLPRTSMKVLQVLHLPSHIKQMGSK